MSKSTLKTFRVTFGNLDTRKGHRRDCAQVQVSMFLKATSKQSALLRMEEILAERKGKAWSCKTADGAIMSVTLKAPHADSIIEVPVSVITEEAA